MNGPPICGLLLNRVQLKTARALLCLGTLKGRTIKVHSFWKVRENLVIEGLNPESVATLLIDKMIKKTNKKTLLVMYNDSYPSE